MQLQLFLLIKPLQFLGVPDFLLGKTRLLAKLLERPHVLGDLDLVEMPEEGFEPEHIGEYVRMVEEVYLRVLHHRHHIQLEVLYAGVVAPEDLVDDREDVEGLVDDLPVVRALEVDLVGQVDEEVGDRVLADELDQQEAHEDALWDLAADQSLRLLEDTARVVLLVCEMRVPEWCQSFFVLDLVPFPIGLEDEAVAVVFELERVHGSLQLDCVLGSQVSEVGRGGLRLRPQQRGELLRGLGEQQLVKLRLFHYYYILASNKSIGGRWKFHMRVGSIRK